MYHKRPPTVSISNLYGAHSNHQKTHYNKVEEQKILTNPVSKPILARNNEESSVRPLVRLTARYPPSATIKKEIERCEVLSSRVIEETVNAGEGNPRETRQ